MTRWAGGFRAEVARPPGGQRFGRPERDACALIAWMEGTAFYALGGAGGSARPSLAELHAQVAGLLATMIAVRHDRRR